VALADGAAPDAAGGGRGAAVLISGAGLLGLLGAAAILWLGWFAAPAPTDANAVAQAEGPKPDVNKPRADDAGKALAPAADKDAVHGGDKRDGSAPDPGKDRPQDKDRPDRDALKDGHASDASKDKKDGPGPDKEPDLEALRRTLQDGLSGRSDRLKAIAGLKQLGPKAQPAADDLLRVLCAADEDQDVRDRAEEVLEKFDKLEEISPPSPEHLRRLAAALADGRTWKARRYAARSLGKLKELALPERDALVKALDDSAREVREATASALGGLGTGARKARPRLRAALKDEVEAVRKTALAALDSLGPPGPDERGELERLLAERKGPPEPRQYAARALGDLGGGSASALAEAVAADPEPDVVCDALKQLGRLQVPSRAVGQALALAVESPEPEVRRLAAAALKKIGLHQLLLGAVFKARAGKDAQVRDAATGLLPPMGSFVKKPLPFELTRDALDDLKAALGSEAPEVRARAAYLLGVLGEAARPAAAELCKALDAERHPDAQLELLCAVAAVGPDARAALPRLRQLLAGLPEDPDAVLRQRCAALAVARVGGDDGVRKDAYKLLTRALLRDVALPADKEPELYERAKAALLQGGKLAAEVLVNLYSRELYTRKNDPANFAPERVGARRTALLILAGIGSEAGKVDGMKKALDVILDQKDDEEVMKAARSAYRAVLQTK
jgi:HEAT repeat protein